MIETILGLSDLISGGFGLLAAIVLGWPALKAVRAKRYWETHQELMRDNQGTSVGSGLEQAERDLLSLQLGGSRKAQVCNLVGMVLLFLAFTFLLLAAIERRSHTGPELSPNTAGAQAT